MNGGKVGTVTVVAKKVNFRFSFTIPGHEEVSGTSNRIIDGNPDQERVQREINEYVSQRVLDFIKSKNIDDENVQLEAKIEVIATSNVNIEMRINAAR